MFVEMSHLECGLQCLRGLILGSNDVVWDYCVVWKLGDDPSRFIEWMGCCCSGGRNQELGFKKIKKFKNNSNQVCRDSYFVHLANTKSCEALARFPPYMSVFSGLHGEVVISCQPHWFTTAANMSDQNTLTEESFGTQVLIPVFGGLVELYSSKQIEEDKSVIGYVKAQFIKSEIETMSTSTVRFDEHPFNPLFDRKTKSCMLSLNQPSITAQPRSLIPVAIDYIEPPLDGSSTGSFPSDERPSPDSTPCSMSQDNPPKPLSSCHEDPVITKGRVENRHKLERGHCKSKNLLTERNRRQRINNGILSLRALVPKITKMHKAATLSDAIDYIMELNNEINELKGELCSLSIEDCGQINRPKLKDIHLDEQVKPPKKANTSLAERSQLEEVNVQVTQLGAGNFLLRIICLQRPGAFTMLLQALLSLGLLVKDVNLTTCDGRVSTIFTVQSNKKEIREKDLRDSLVRLKAEN